MPERLSLPEAHVRHLSAILVLLDQRLDEMERWASGPLPSGPLHRWRRDLAPPALREIRREVGKARKELAAVAGVFGLHPQQRVASTSVQTAATFSLIDLEELQPRHMAAYGPLTEEQAAALATAWGPLKDLLEAIRAQCSPREERGAVP